MTLFNSAFSEFHHLYSYILCRYALSTYFIEGLVQYIPTSSSGLPTATATAADTTAKNRKKDANNKSKDSVGLGDAENLLIARIPASQVENTTFFKNLDSLVRLASLNCFYYLFFFLFT